MQAVACKAGRTQGGRHGEEQGKKVEGNPWLSRVVLVPGAGLEPARTLPGPRDFKSYHTLAEQYQAQSHALLSRGLRAGVCPRLLLPSDSLGTVTGTVSHAPRTGVNRHRVPGGGNSKLLAPARTGMKRENADLGFLP